MRGRKQKPTTLKILNGNPGKRPLPAARSNPLADMPECPEWLCDDAKEAWNTLVPELFRMGVICSLDRAILTVYCEAVAMFKSATETLAKEGLFYKSHTGSVAAHPCVSIQRSATKTILSCAAEIGATPAARMRLNVLPPSPERDALDEFLKRS